MNSGKSTTGEKMYRNNEQLLDVDKINFVCNHGALGDVITSLPAMVFARQMYHLMLKMRVWVPSYQMELVAHLLAPYGEFDVREFEKFPMKVVDRGADWEGGAVALNQLPHNTHTRNRVHMVDYAFNCLLDAQPESMLERSYPTLAPLGEQWILNKYVVFPVGATSANKLFKASVMAPIIRWVHERGYTPVIVGTKTSHTKAQTSSREMIPIVLIDEADKIPMDLCHDLREMTTLSQLRDICGYAAAVVGTDGGTLHVAGTTDTNIIYGLTTTLPKHRYIARNGEPSHKIRYVGPRDLECAGCQSNWVMSHQDFRFCAYGDNICTEKLDAADFIAGLEELGL